MVVEEEDVIIIPVPKIPHLLDFFRLLHQRPRVAVCAAAGHCCGARVFVPLRTQSNEFYEDLDKPAWAPSATTIHGVWIAMFILLGVSAYNVAQHAARKYRRVHRAISIWLFQLIMVEFSPMIFLSGHLTLTAVYYVVLCIAAVVIGFWVMASTSARPVSSSSTFFGLST